jgi:hypothetical protein
MVPSSGPKVRPETGNKLGYLRRFFMNLTKMYPIDEVVWQTRHGNILTYRSGDILVQDQDLAYLDDTMDCLDQFKGPPERFKAYVIECQQKELRHLSRSHILPPDDLKAGIEIMRKKIGIAATEPEEGMRRMCIEWRANRELTKAKLLREFHGRREGM